MRRNSRSSGARRYPRTDRINQILHEIVADDIERLSAYDDRFALLTVTGVACQPDLHEAVVYLASMNEVAEAALEEERGRVQRSIARQTRIKRTPRLSFRVDPAIVEAEQIERIIRNLHADEENPGPDG